VVFAVLLAGALGSQSATAEVVDRIVAIVNGNVILQSDWDEALSFEALLANRALANFANDDRRAVLDRLIDQELLRQQMKSSDFPHATDAEVSARLAEARKLYPEATSDAAWQTILATYHLSEKDLIDHVRQQIDLMRLVDARLRPAVQIDSKSIEAYYRDQFVPQLKQTGSREVPLADVSVKIRELLTEKRVNELLVSWLQTLRSEGQVHLPGVSPLANEGGVRSQ
jgi:peptidyl-prolyl cis-trans isomerase SurA